MKLFVYQAGTRKVKTFILNENEHNAVQTSNPETTRRFPRWSRGGHMKPEMFQREITRDEAIQLIKDSPLGDLPRSVFGGDEDTRWFYELHHAAGTNQRQLVSLLEG